MPSLFRRRPVDAEPEDVASTAEVVAAAQAKSHTPSKRDLGKATPKRKEGGGRRAAEPPPANRREALKRMREKERGERTEARKGMLAGDEKYLLPRDRGPERSLVRDVVDARRTIGTYFFGVTFLVMLLGFTRALLPAVYLAATMLFALLAVATAVDVYLITRRVRTLIRERFPKTTQRLGSLYFYAGMRSISFRFIRNPKPKVKVGAPI